MWKKPGLGSEPEMQGREDSAKGVLLRQIVLGQMGFHTTRDTGAGGAEQVPKLSHQRGGGPGHSGAHSCWSWGVHPLTPPVSRAAFLSSVRAMWQRCSYGTGPGPGPAVMKPEDFGKSLPFLSLTVTSGAHRGVEAWQPANRKQGKWGPGLLRPPQSSSHKPRQPLHTVTAATTL